MARIKFRQFEQELQPGQQVYDVPAFQDVPAPENKISDVLLSENVAWQKLGDTILDLGTTAGKIVASEQTRLRKKQWDLSAPKAMGNLNNIIGRRILADYQGGLTPTQVNDGWDNFTSETMMEFRDGAEVQSVHPDDRPKLLALLRGRLESGEVNALKNAYGMDNDLQTNTVLSKIRGKFGVELRKIQDPNFNVDEDGVGDGHNMSLEQFTLHYIQKPISNIIENEIKKRNIESPMIKDRIRLQIASEVESFTERALSHHSTIKSATAAGLWEQELLDQVQTSALRDNKYRRRDGDEESDTRIAPAEELIDKAVGLRYITPEDAPRRKLGIRNLLDLNDVKTDIEDNPELALQRLSTEPITLDDKIKFFKEHDIQLNDKGGLALSKRPENYDVVDRDWKELEANTGGFYPTIQGGTRQDFITKAQKALDDKKDADRRLVFNQLDAGLRIIIDPNVDITEIQKVLDPEYIDQHLGARNIKKWELDQYKFLYQYGMEVRKGAGDFKMLSSQGMKEVESKLNPSNMDFEVSETEIFKRNLMDQIYNGFLDATAEVRKLRSQDQAAVGFQKVTDRELDPFSEEGLMVMLTDQLNWKGEIDFGASAEPQNFPSVRELTRRVEKEELSIWTKGMAEKVETDWNAITETGSGIQKKKYLQDMLRKYGDYAPVVLQQMFKMKGFSRADQLYTVIQDPAVLENLNTSQKNRDDNKKNAAVILDDDFKSYEELRTEIGREGVIKDFMMTYHLNGQDKNALIDMYTDYVLQLKNQNPSIGADDLIDKEKDHASVFRHLVKDLYEVIPGGSGANVKVRIPSGELEGRDPEDLEDGLNQFTRALLIKRSNNKNWNFVRGEDDASFLGISTGDVLYQWKTNADESGMTLTFYNKAAGMFQPALYKGKTTTLTWKHLRSLSDNRKRPVLEWIDGTIKEFENYQFFSAERIQQTAENMDLENTPINLRPEKQEKINQKRKERLEEQKIKKKEEDKKEEERVISPEEKEHRKQFFIKQNYTEEQAERLAGMPDDKRDEEIILEQRAGAYRDLENNDGKKLTEKEIKKLLKMTGEKAQTELIRMGF